MKPKRLEDLYMNPLRAEKIAPTRKEALLMERVSALEEVDVRSDLDVKRVMERVSALEDLAQTLVTVSKQLVAGADTTHQHVLQLAKGGWERDAKIATLGADIAQVSGILDGVLETMPMPVIETTPTPSILKLADGYLFMTMPLFPEIAAPDYGAFFDDFLFDLISEAVSIGVFNEDFAYNTWAMVLGTQPTSAAEYVVPEDVLLSTAHVVGHWKSFKEEVSVPNMGNHATFLTGMIASMLDAVSADQVAVQIDDMFKLVFMPDDLFSNLVFIDVGNASISSDAVTQAIKKCIEDDAATGWSSGRYAL